MSNALGSRRRPDLPKALTLTDGIEWFQKETRRRNWVISKGKTGEQLPIPVRHDVSQHSVTGSLRARRYKQMEGDRSFRNPFLMCCEKLNTIDCITYCIPWNQTVIKFCKKALSKRRWPDETHDKRWKLRDPSRPGSLTKSSWESRIDGS